MTRDLPIEGEAYGLFIKYIRASDNLLMEEAQKLAQEDPESSTVTSSHINRAFGHLRSSDLVDRIYERAHQGNSPPQ